MSFLAAYRGATGGTGANITYTFPTGNIDTTTLQPGQAFDIRTYLFNQNIIRSLDVTTCLNVIVPSGCTLGSSLPSRPALTIANFKSRDRVIINNYGNIYGAAGPSGTGGYSNTTNGSNGGNGGNALVTTVPLILNNYGLIAGGGGGGGGGGGRYVGSTYQCNPYQCNPYSCRSSGGYVKGGSSCGCGEYTAQNCYFGGKGAYICENVPHCYNCTTCYNTCYQQCDNSQRGTGGSGGQGLGYGNLINLSGSAGTNGGGGGGSGGNFGQAGNPGSSLTTAGGTGGTDGYSISGHSLCKIDVLGTVYGSTYG